MAFLPPPPPILWLQRFAGYGGYYFMPTAQEVKLCQGKLRIRHSV